MRVDFYQLAGPEGLAETVAAIASRVLGDGGRLLLVEGDEAARARLDRMLWEEGGPTGFLPHGLAGGIDDPRQPMLISGATDAPNVARFLLIADGEWREAALHYERTFFLFDDDKVEAARKAWRSLGQREAMERHYWAREDGRWVRKA